MDFSGYSTDVVVVGDVRRTFSRFSARLHEKWPNHLVNGSDSTSVDFGSISLDAESQDATSDIFTFSRDQSMEEFWEESGYSLDAAGEGPVAVFCKPFKRFSVQVDSGTEVATGASWQGALVAISEGFHLSLVTPEDPSDDDFSRWVKDCLIESLWDPPPTPAATCGT